jgi:hypothetical protein
MPAKSTAADRPRSLAEPGPLALVCVAAWLVPGAGHLWLGRRQKGIVFFAAIPLMFLVGLQLQGTIFPFQFAEPLAGLAAAAEFATGVPWILSRLLAVGDGVVTSPTWEYGNTFMIVAGLLNALVVLDAFDIGMGRK